MLTISAPADYEQLLRTRACVIPAFSERRDLIRSQLDAEGRRFKAQVVIDDDLLDEVTALVEWPVALTGSFDESYLDVPQEALISALKEHQKCFHMVDNSGALLPRFITISNIESRDPQQVIAGNERVIGPRLADAAFFYQQDKKQSLASRRDKLKTVIFQQQLGTVFEKSERVASLAAHIARELGTSEDKALRAARLGKCDLLTSMVYEFAELQGIMGSYYAQADGEDPEVAQALREQYLPRFANDELPATDTGTVLALAERLDTIVGLFSLGQPPTGSKDPFALRRAALGILRILIEKQLTLDIHAAVVAACREMPGNFDKAEIAESVVDFIFERLRAWYQDQDIGIDVFQAVDAVRPASPLDFDLRMQAVSRFRQLPQAQALAAANKRVANILAKLDTEPSDQLDNTLLTEPAESALAQALENRREAFVDLYMKRDYAAALESLAALQPAIDSFFDQVMVNTDNEAVRSNRQALLKQVRRLFLRIADISFLQSQTQAS
jgi:glycyl-tRNA synthetase beta chain